MCWGNTAHALSPGRRQGLILRAKTASYAMHFNGVVDPHTRPGAQDIAHPGSGRLGQCLET